MLQKLEHGISERKLLFILLIIVFLVRLLVFVTFPSEKPGRELEVDRWGIVAINVAEGRGYVYYSDPPIPDAVRGPVPVLWFALIFFLFGYNLWPIVIGNWLLHVGAAAVLFYLARHVFPKKRLVAVLAVLMFAAYVPAIIWGNLAMSEPIFTFLLILHLLTLIHLLERPTLGGAVMAGLWLGLAALARPIMLVFPAIIFAFMLFQYRRPWKIAKLFGIVVATFLIVLSPWIIRNYLTFDAFIPGTIYSGYTLLLGNYHLDSPDFPLEIPFSELEPNMERILNDRGDSLDNYNVVDRDKLYAREAINRISKYPGRYLQLTGYRFLRLWFNIGFGAPPSIRSWLVAGVQAVLLILVVLSFIWESRVRELYILPIWATLIFFTLIHIPLYATLRYIFPVMPLVMLLAASVIYRILAKLFTFKTQQFSSMPTGVGVE